MKHADINTAGKVQDGRYHGHSSFIRIRMRSGFLTRSFSRAARYHALMDLNADMLILPNTGTHSRRACDVQYETPASSRRRVPGRGRGYPRRPPRTRT